MVTYGMVNDGIDVQEDSAVEDAVEVDVKVDSAGENDVEELEVDVKEDSAGEDDVEVDVQTDVESWSIVFKEIDDEDGQVDADGDVGVGVGALVVVSRKINVHGCLCSSNFVVKLIKSGLDWLPQFSFGEIKVLNAPTI